MAYYDQVQLSRDADFIDRVAAAGADEMEPTAGVLPPDQWARNNVWWIAAAPGFGDAYATALVNGVPNPGRDPSVISDPQILSAVQAFVAQTAPGQSG
jgi:hypothetical protein